MSLLLDALKRAEQEKLARGGGLPSPPPPPPASGPRAVPASGVPSLELQPIASAGLPPPASAAKGDAHAAAQAVFQAKAPPPPASGERRMGMVWATIGAVAVVVIAAGAYVWYSINALTPQMAAAPRAAPMAPPPPAPSAPVTTAMVEAAAAQPSPAPAPAAASAPPRVAALVPAARDPQPEPAIPAVASAAMTADRLLREADRPAGPAPLKLDRSQEARRVPAAVAAGYEALRTGDVGAARRSYEAALAADPANLDARLGMATAEARAGNRPAAAHHYRRALESDPRNTTALAGLAALSDFARPDALEASLRADVERHPGSAALRFALGSLHASQRRWHDAQAQFFEAHRLEPGSPDILFNLAVSLDHLGQARLAADFYARALEAARAQPAQFDPAAASRRLAEIR